MNICDACVRIMHLQYNTIRYSFRAYIYCLAKMSQECILHNDAFRKYKNLAFCKINIFIRTQLL